MDAPPAARTASACPTRGVVRLGRAAALGCLSLLLATAAHVVGGDRLPSAGMLAVTAALLGMVAVTVTARRCRFWLVLVVMAVEQLLLHLLFTAAAATSSCAVAMAGMGHRLPGAAHALPGCLPPPPAGAMTTMARAGWAMWAGHALATVVTAWVLACGEAWLWRVVDRAIHRACVRPGGLRIRRAYRPATPAPTSAVGWRVRSLAEPRGPPAILVLD